MQPPKDNGIIFFDDFTTNELDRNNWNVVVTEEIYNNEQQAYIDSEETIYLLEKEEDANGVLVIQPRYRKGYVSKKGDIFDFVSGRINTRGKFYFKYGIIEARIKLPLGVGLWPAFWTLGTNGPWPCCGELDVMEYVGEQDWISAAVHGPNYSGENALVNKKFFLPPDDVTNWHVYSLDWTPDNFDFMVDGELIYRANYPMVRFFGPWVFDQPHFILLNLALGGHYPFKTNRINKPYYGMPESTVNAIKNNEVKMLVDWVKVSRDIDRHLQ